jgi:hypothetical protein
VSLGFRRLGVSSSTPEQEILTVPGQSQYARSGVGNNHVRVDLAVFNASLCSTPTSSELYSCHPTSINISTTSQWLPILSTGPSSCSRTTSKRFPRRVRRKGSGKLGRRSGVAFWCVVISCFTFSFLLNLRSSESLSRGLRSCR